MPPEKYSHIDFKPPGGVRTAARRAQQWIREGEAGSGFTDVGRQRAADLADADYVPSPEVVRRMFSYLSRHEPDKDAEGFNRGEDGYPTPGRVAWDAWGGDAGFSFSSGVVRQMNAADEDGGKAESLNARLEAIRRAFYDQHQQHQEAESVQPPPRYVVDIYDDFVVAEVDGDHYMIGYRETEDGAEFDPESEWVPVEKEWVTDIEDTESQAAIKRGAELLDIINRAAVLKRGNALKALNRTDDEIRVGNYIVLFGGRDLEGEYFTEGTELESSYTKANVLPVDWEHGVMDGKAEPGRDDVLGRVDWSTARMDDNGVFVERVLNRHARYMDAIESLIEEGFIGSSTEPVQTGVEKADDGRIVRWPLKRDALTITPMEPRMVIDNPVALKALEELSEAYPNLKALLPKAAGETATDDATDGKADGTDDKPRTTIEVSEMDEKDNGAPAVEREELERISGDVAALTESQRETNKAINALLERMEKSGPLKDAGYTAPDSEEDHPENKSIGDWLIAVKRGNKKRLAEVYGSKAMSGEDGTSGGYLVPDDFEARLMEVASSHGVVRQRAFVQPVTTSSGRIPALNQTTAPSANGQTALAGGVVAGWVGEGGSISETAPTFNMVQWQIHKLAGYTQAPNELVSDSAIGIEALLTRLFGTAIAAHEDYAFLQGDGVGKPLGVLNAPAVITAGTDDGNFTAADALDMISHFMEVGGTGAWFLNKSVIPDFESQFTLAIRSADSDESVGAMVSPREALPQELYGYPLVYTEMLPVADNTGDVLLADMQGYVIFDRAGLAIAYSEHAAFLTDEGTWRFTKRVDGQPWLKSSITQHDQSHTLSPFVQHDD